MCISESLVCDGVDNCADSSDESTQFDVCGKRRRSCMSTSPLSLICAALLDPNRPYYGSCPSVRPSVRPSVLRLSVCLTRKQRGLGKRELV